MGAAVETGTLWRKGDVLKSGLFSTHINTQKKAKDESLDFRCCGNRANICQATPVVAGAAAPVASAVQGDPVQQLMAQQPAAAPLRRRKRFLHIKKLHNDALNY